MGYFIEMFGDITLSSLTLFIASVAFLAGVGLKAYQFIVADHDNRQEKEETLKQILESLKEVQKEQTIISEQVKFLTEKQLEISTKQDEFEAQNRAHSQNKLRDRLLQSYRFYTNSERNPMLAWSEMEKEAFDKLFQDYESYGGNGFMHSTVQPAMGMLEIIPMSDMDGLSELSASRKG